MDKAPIDDNGYLRGKPEHSDLIHRQIAWEKIYKKNREEYPLRFREYEVHHRDRDKHNNGVSNLDIVTRDEHQLIHEMGLAGRKELYAHINKLDKKKRKSKERKPKKEVRKRISATKLFFIILFIIVILLNISNPLYSLYQKYFPDKVNFEAIKCNYDYYDCADFKNRAEAQRVYELCKLPSNNRVRDIHYLDGDGDDNACESLE